MLSTKLGLAFMKQVFCLQRVWFVRKTTFNPTILGNFSLHLLKYDKSACINIAKLLNLHVDNSDLLISLFVTVFELGILARHIATVEHWGAFRFHILINKGVLCLIRTRAPLVCGCEFKTVQLC